MRPQTVRAEDKVARDRRFLEWLRLHGVDTASTYRVDVGLFTIRVHQFALDDQGRKHIDPGTGDVARKKPFRVRRLWLRWLMVPAP